MCFASTCDWARRLGLLRSFDVCAAHVRLDGVGVFVLISHACLLYFKVRCDTAEGPKRVLTFTYVQSVHINDTALKPYGFIAYIKSSGQTSIERGRVAWGGDARTLRRTRAKVKRSHTGTVTVQGPFIFALDTAPRSRPLVQTQKVTHSIS